jgi:hypothetical protein
VVPKDRKPGNEAAPGNGAAQLPALVELASVVDPDLAVVIKHPLRVQIIAVAHQREISKSEFAKEAKISLKESIGHFDALIESNFLELTRKEGVGSAVKYMYRATKRAYFSVIDWGRLGKEVQKGMGEAVLADLNGRVTDALEAGTFQARDDTVLYWLGLSLDEQSWPEFVKILTWAIQEVHELCVDTANRRANGEDQGRSFPVTFGVAGFESPDGAADRECQFSADQARNARRNSERDVAPGEQNGEREAGDGA